MMSQTTLQVLYAAVLRILRPLVRLLLRNGVSYGTFADLAKWVYVGVATDEFAIRGRKQSISRVAVITGLSRKEILRVRQLPRPDDQEVGEQYNRAARVISGWLRDEAFADADGRPALLPFEGRGATFSTLVKRHSGDVPARAILDELVRLGAVEWNEGGTVRLLTHGYIPHASPADKLGILGTDVAHLIATIDHNLDPGGGGPFFQRKVAYDNLPDEALPEFRVLSAEQAQALLERLNRWLAEHDRDTNPSIGGSGRNRAGIGIYYFEERDSDEGRSG